MKKFISILLACAISIIATQSVFADENNITNVRDCAYIAKQLANAHITGIIDLPVQADYNQDNKITVS